MDRSPIDAGEGEAPPLVTWVEISGVMLDSDVSKIVLFCRGDDVVGMRGDEGPFRLRAEHVDAANRAMRRDMDLILGKGLGLQRSDSFNPLLVLSQLLSPN